MSQEEQGDTEPAARPTPLLRVVKGDPTDAEVAALVSVVSAMSAAARASHAGPEPRPLWSAHDRKIRAFHRHGPGVWRSGAR